MVCNFAAKYPGTGKRATMITIPTTALGGWIKGGNANACKLHDLPPTQDGVQKRNAKGDLDRASDGDHEEIPPVDHVVQVRGYKVIDFADEVSALFRRRFLLSLYAGLIDLRWGGLRG